MTALHPSILRAYDIRGIVGETLHMEDARAIGRAFGSYVIRKSGKDTPRVAVGYDGRHSSPEMEAALADGLQSAGVQVQRVGLGPTPMLYFAVRKHKLDGGVMVTGSHNPPTHNGFKFMIGKDALFGEEIQQLGQIADVQDFESGAGTADVLDVKAEYLETLLAGYTAERGLKVAWDAGNGAAGEVMAVLTQRLPGEHILLNEVIDGDFPAHHPDPTEEKNLQQLIETVRRKSCDLGVAFDGDGDRVGAVDGQGRVIWGDQLMMLYARDVLAEHPGATIIADVKASQSLFDTVKTLGGNPLVWKTGHSFIKSKMAETGALLAGEMSGHIFFADDYYGFDDGLYAAVRLLNLVAKSEESLSDMLNALPVMVNTPEIRIEVPEERKFAVIEEIRERLQRDGVAFSDIDGVRVMMEGGWWLIRASNTQAALSMRCEAESEEALTRIQQNLEAQLQESGMRMS